MARTTHFNTRLAMVASTLALCGAVSAQADPCRLSIVLDRTGSMGGGGSATSKCSIALEFATGVIQGYINGDNVSIVPDPADPGNPTFPVIDADFYDGLCPLAERTVEVVTVSDPVDLTSAPVSLTRGFVAPDVALAQLQALAATDDALTSSCNGLTPLADTMCTALDSLVAGFSDPFDTRVMKIITDGGENSSDLDLPTTCDASVPFGDPGYESSWISNTFVKFATSPATRLDSIMFTDLFLDGTRADRTEKQGTVSRAARLSEAETNLLVSLAINSGGTAELLDSTDDVATTFTDGGDVGIELCNSDLDADFDVDNLDALLFSQDFNNAACQISTRRPAVLRSLRNTDGE